MSTSNYRKCAKCGKTRIQDMTVTYHRFPTPGISNFKKAHAWAKYCWPTKNWTHESLLALNTSSKVLCGRHFSSSQFYDNKRQHLSKFAVPDVTDEDENALTQNVAESPHAPEQLTLRMPLSEIYNIMPSTSAAASSQYTVMDTSKPLETTNYELNVAESHAPEQLMLRMPLSQILNIHDITPSTSAASSSQYIVMDTSKTLETTNYEQNVAESPHAPEQLTLRMPLSEIYNIMPSTSAAASSQYTVMDTSKPLETTNYELKMEDSNASKQLTSRQPFSHIENVIGKPCTSTTVSSVEIMQTHKKRSGILSSINVSKVSEMTPREVKLYNICRKKLREILRLRKKLRNRKANVIDRISQDENVKELCDLNISNSFIVLLQSQIKNAPKKPKGRRYTLNQKIMALVIYKKSPACYRLLRRLFTLPCQSSLNKLLNSLPLKPGINQHVFGSLKKMAKKQTDEENTCILSFDEMSIRKNLCYDSKKDEILGFQDHGNHGRSNEVANKALVFMLAGLRKKWKQPVAFYFSHTINADRMTVILKEVLTECFNANVNVVATVCDLSSVNMKVLKTLGATTRDPFFMHDSREIVTILDPPHLLKCTRNLLMKHNVECTTNLCSNDENVKGLAKWSHIQTFYDLDKNNKNFIFAPALTDYHLQPNLKQKMRVKLAAQVFSHSVTAGILAKIATNDLPAEAHATATFIKKFDELFDAVNADTPDLRRGKKYSTNITTRSPHIELFREMRKFISSMKYLGSKTKPPSQDGWIHTMNGIEKLWQNVQKLKIKTLSTRRLNQDPLENCFGCIRYNCGSNNNPTIQQFVAGIKTAIISNLKFSGQRKNCEDDNAVLSNNLTSFLINSVPQHGSVNNSSVEENVDYVDELLADALETVDKGISESQACGYVCGFIYKKLQNKECPDCKKALLAENLENIHIFTSFKEYNTGDALHYASREMIIYVESSANIINNYLKENGWLPKIRENVINRLDILDDTFLKKCSEHFATNKRHINISTFYICIKKYIIFKNREMDEEEKKKALVRKMLTVTNK